MNRAPAAADAAVQEIQMLRVSLARPQQSRFFRSRYSGVQALRFTLLRIVSKACRWQPHDHQYGTKAARLEMKEIQASNGRRSFLSTSASH